MILDDGEDVEKLVASVPHWHHTFEIFPGVITPGAYNPGFLWEKMGAGANWQSARVLDIGPADGAISKWAADAQASVTCVDRKPKSESGFRIMERLSGDSFDFYIGNITDTPEMYLETFDIVLFLGVLYHLPDLLLGLHSVRIWKLGAIMIWRLKSRSTDIFRRELTMTGQIFGCQKNR